MRYIVWLQVDVGRWDFIGLDDHLIDFYENDNDILKQREKIQNKERKQLIHVSFF